MKTSFGKGGRPEAGLGASALGSAGDDGYGFPSPDLRHGKVMGGAWGRVSERRKGKGNELSTVDSDDEGENTRSRSVPPRLEESPTRTKTVEPLISSAGMGQREEERESDLISSGSGTFGAGGKLSVNTSDPTVFRVSIEGKRVEFELSLLEIENDVKSQDNSGTDGNDEELYRGRQARNSKTSRPSARSRVRVYSPDGRWPGIDEFETARLFEKGKISFREFIQNDDLVHDPRLVVRWTRQQ